MNLITVISQLIIFVMYVYRSILRYITTFDPTCNRSITLQFEKGAEEKNNSCAGDSKQRCQVYNQQDATEICKTV